MHPTNAGSLLLLSDYDRLEPLNLDNIKNIYLPYVHPRERHDTVFHFRPDGYSTRIKWLDKTITYRLRKTTDDGSTDARDYAGYCIVEMIDVVIPNDETRSIILHPYEEARDQGLLIVSGEWDPGYVSGTSSARFGLLYMKNKYKDYSEAWLEACRRFTPSWIIRKVSKPVEKPYSGQYQNM